MSLRAFHIVFVVVSITLSVYVAVWGVLEYLREGSGTALALALIFSAAAVGLVVYGVKVSRKLKELP